MKRVRNEGAMLWNNDLGTFVSTDGKSYWERGLQKFVPLSAELLRQSETREAQRRERFALIPFNEWLKQAGALPGKTSLAVALGVIHETNLNRGQSAVLSNQLLSFLGVDPAGKHRGLKALEKAGLIKVKRRRGANPVVTMLSAKSPKISDTESAKAEKS